MAMGNIMNDWNEINDNDWNKIIAIRFGSLICFGQDAVDKFNDHHDYDQLLSCAEFKFLARLDLGDKWRKYAETAPTIFTLKIPLTASERNPRPYRKGCYCHSPNCQHYVGLAH